MAMVQERYLWLTSLKKSLEKRGNAITHTSFEGVTTSGKTYLAFWFAELGVMMNLIKFCHLWI